MTLVMERQSGPNLLIRFVWWLFIGRPRTRTWVLGQEADGRAVVSERSGEQLAWPIRGLWFIVVGWWASALWMGAARLIQLTVIGLPLALLMFNRTPFVASLYRY